MVSVFFVSKGITDLKTKGVYVLDLIKKGRYWPKGVPGDLIDTHFEDKDVDNVGMIEARTEYYKLFKIFCMKEPDYAMKIIAIWMTLDELEGASTRIYFIDMSGTKDTKQFTYWQPFGIHFRYIHQVENQNNWKHTPIYPDRTRSTKFWPDRNIAWYLVVSEKNTALALSRFQNYGVGKPSLDFCRALVI